MPQVLKPGDRVLHKAWRIQPGEGEVLVESDPRAWAGTRKFPEAEPDPEAVKEHVQNCKDHGLLSDGKIPVLWDSGKVFWHKPDLLKLVAASQPAKAPKGLTVESSGARQRFSRYRAKGGKIVPLIARGKN